MASNRGRHWVITSFASTHPVFDATYLHYLIYQPEITPSTGKPHWQTYCEAIKAHTRKKILEITGCVGGHAQLRSGSRESAREYCMPNKNNIPGKPGTVNGPYVEFGTFRDSAQGSRTDISAASDLIARDNKRVRDVAIQFSEQYVKYHKGFHALRSILAAPRSEKTECYVYWGPTGTGKSWAAHHEWEVEHPDWSCYDKDPIHLWWSLYDNEDVVVIDDFAPKEGKMSLPYMLRLLDGYPLLIEPKGSMHHFNSKRVYITSNFHPDMWWGPVPQYAALRRRLTKVKNFTKKYIPDDEKESEPEFMPLLSVSPLNLQPDSPQLEWNEIPDL